MNFTDPSTRRAGSALISTLLAIVVLTIIVTAFLQSMSTEQQTARSYLNKVRADLAAQSGANEAIVLVRNLIEANPDSVTTWSANAGPSKPLPATVLYYYPTSPVASEDPAEPMSFRPLVSGSSSATFPAAPATAVSDAAGTVDINLDGLGGRGGKWIGNFPSGSVTRDTNPTSEVNVPWVEVLDDSGTRVVARYAFWVEDESFRLNLNTSGSDPRTATSLGRLPDEIPLQAAVTQPNPEFLDPAGFAGGIVEIRNLLGAMPTLDTVNQLEQADISLADDLKPLITLHSEGSNRTRSGALRTNLNDVVSNSTDPDEIRAELDEIIETIDREIPTFGQRMRSGATVPAADAEIYVERIAANIRDYIDQDSNPIHVRPDGGIEQARPVLAIGTPGGQNDFRTIGKEGVPRLQETLMRIRQGTGMGGPGATSSPYQIRISFYFEFWNPTTRDISVADLSSTPGANDAFLRIANQPSWEDAGTDPTKMQPFIPPDLEIPLANFRNANGDEIVFPAGEITVLSTDPDRSLLVGPTGAHVFKPGANTDNLYTVNGEQVFSGTLRQNNRAGYGGRPTLQMITRTSTGTNPTSGTWSDYETEVLLGNALGHLESHAQAFPIETGVFADSFGSKSNNAFFHLRGGAMRGNMSDLSTVLGDPTASLDARQFSPAGPNSISGFRNWRGSAGQSSLDPAQKSTIGLPSTAFVNPSGLNWNDGFPGAETASGISSALYHVANQPLESIGELGNIFDPRVPATFTNAASVGGGRTLRIGQPEAEPSQSEGRDIPDPVWDGVYNSAGRLRTAWRLLDIFSTHSDPVRRGLVNPNGALRDNGAALRATLTGFEFQSAGEAEAGSPTRSGKDLTQAELDELVESLIDRLADASLPPLFERGELSELRYFLEGSFAGSEQSGESDRAREEVFRRIVELVTTRGNIFTVYAVGQSVQDTGSGALRPLATSFQKVTFRLLPSTVASAPTYDVEILAAE